MIVTATSQPRTGPRRVPTRRATVRVQGRAVDLLTVGDPHDDPVLFLHGFGANPFIYLRSLTALARRGRYVIAPALPSFGDSDPLPVSQQNVSGVAEHVVAFLRQRYPDTQPLDFVGHSFGGGVSLRVAATHPEWVKSLTLVCPVGGAGQGAATVAGVLRGVLCGDAGKGWVRNGVRHFLPALVRHPSGVVATGLSAWFSDQLADVEAVDRAGLPVRFLFAKQDRLVRPGRIPTCVSANVQVEVQQGRHSWLIGESDRFVEVVLGPQAEPGPLQSAA